MQDTSQPPLVKAVELFLMPRICGPGFTTVEESTEHTGLINVYPGFLSEVGVVPTHWFSLAITAVALAILLLTSTSMESEFEIVDPR